MKKLAMILAVAGLILVGTGPVEATIVDLSVEPASGTSVQVNETFSLDIWARFAESGQWNTTDIIFEWDPAYLQLDGKTDNPIFGASFWPGHPINNTWADGDAGYSAWHYVTNITEDTRVVTLNFTALAVVPSTMFNIVLNATAYPAAPTTMVIDPTTFTDCHGQLYGAEIEVVPEPATMCLLGLGGLGLLLRRRSRKA